ncbi:MAG: ABC transporter permease [Bacteroidales bacterium]|nr:ABC transporter permease [Bacteroidales bacterium]
MNGFASFVKKETLHIFRDFRTMMIVLLIPIVLMVLFGFAISTEVNNVDVAVVAPNRGDEVSKAVSRLQHNPYFTFKGFINADEIDHTLRSGNAMAVAVFDNDFNKKSALAKDAKAKPTVQIVLDAADVNTASSSAIYLQSVLTENAMSKQTLFNTHLLYNPQLKSAYNFVPGIMGLIFILICAMMTSVSIVREKESGTMEVLLVSPVKPIHIIFAKMIPYFLMSSFNLLTILLLAKYLLDIPMIGGISGIVIISLLYLILSLSFGLLISTLADKQFTALLISAVVMMVPIMMFSGMLFPIENLPLVLRPVSAIVPARWYIDAVRKMMIEGLPLMAVANDFLILLGMTVVLLGVSLKKFNDKLE